MATHMPYIIVSLPSDVWGNEAMENAAKATFAKYPQAEYVKVHEHAGWFLGYAKRTDGSLFIVSTANDAAILSDDAKAFWQQSSGRQLILIATVEA